MSFKALKIIKFNRKIMENLEIKLKDYQELSEIELEISISTWISQ